MDVRLFVAHTKADAKQIALGPETLIGRSPECNLRIASGQVSRRHCVIKVAEGHVLVRDLGSANGTRLNGQTISTEVDVAVPPGSTLVVGPLKFIVQFAAPRLDEDTELLLRSGSGGSSEMHELQKMATARVADGEDTKDYPPTRARTRGDAPPLVVSGDSITASDPPAGAGPGRGHSRQALTTEAEFEAVSNETVFDGVPDAQLADGEGGEGKGRPIGNETDLFFEEDDLRDLARTVEAANESPAAADPGAAGEKSDPLNESEPQSGWRLLDMLRRKTKPAGPHAGSQGPADDADDALRNFLKDP